MNTPYSDFYSGKLNSKGLSIEKIWDFDFEELENRHDYIQWLFPSTDKSMFLDVPDLNTKDIEKLKKFYALSIFRSFCFILKFYGLVIKVKKNGMKIIKDDNYEDRKNVWQTEYNHNYLRITRILKCLKLIGFERYSQAFLNCLLELYKENPKNFNDISISYWKQVLQ